MATQWGKWFAMGLLVAGSVLPIAALADNGPVPAPAPAAAATPPPQAPDPTGAGLGAASDLSELPAKPGVADVIKSVGHNRVAINIVWTLVTGFLVMFMQAGFALVETGLTRAKNVAHTMSMNFMIYPLGMLGFWVCGFAFMFGGLGPLATMGGCGALDSEWTINLFGHPFGILGHKGFFLGSDVYDVGIFALFLFQMVFMDTTATIPTGACAERWKFSGFFSYGLFIGTVMYPVFGNWVWGGGWLSQLGTNFGLGHGHVDFAGSSVVHMQGGVIALIFGWLMGPRIGKYNKDGSVNAIPGHNIPMAMLGTFILAFGWFGFNPGSTLAGSDLRIAVVATNTMLASATGAIAATLWMWLFRTGKPDPSMMCNGMLAGLVAITCPCAFVTSFGACALGLVAGILVVESVFFVEQKLKIDDPVGAISVHGVCGAWGCLSLGLFADGAYGQGWNNSHWFKLVDGTFQWIADPTKAPKGAVEDGVRGLFYGGGMSQLIAETIGVVTCFVTLAVISIIVYKIIEATVGNRADASAEVHGLDVPEMGIPGYVGVKLDKFSETPLSR